MSIDQLSPYIILSAGLVCLIFGLIFSLRSQVIKQQIVFLEILLAIVSCTALLFNSAVNVDLNSSEPRKQLAIGLQIASLLVLLVQFFMIRPKPWSYDNVIVNRVYKTSLLLLALTIANLFLVIN